MPAVEFLGITRLGISQVGDNYASGVVAEGYIDNVVLCTPEPASLSLLALGGLAILRRRRTM